MKIIDNRQDETMNIASFDYGDTVKFGDKYLMVTNSQLLNLKQRPNEVLAIDLNTGTLDYLSNHSQVREVNLEGVVK